jgi:hypothetical protein
MADEGLLGWGLCGALTGAVAVVAYWLGRQRGRLETIQALRDTIREMREGKQKGSR